MGGGGREQFVIDARLSPSIYKIKQKIVAVWMLFPRSQTPLLLTTFKKMHRTTRIPNAAWKKLLLLRELRLDFKDDIRLEILLSFRSRNTLVQSLSVASSSGFV